MNAACLWRPEQQNFKLCDETFLVRPSLGFFTAGFTFSFLLILYTQTCTSDLLSKNKMFLSLKIQTRFSSFISIPNHKQIQRPITKKKTSTKWLLCHHEGVLGAFKQLLLQREHSSTWKRFMCKCVMLGSRGECDISVKVLGRNIIFFTPLILKVAFSTIKEPCCAAIEWDT